MPRTFFITATACCALAAAALPAHAAGTVDVAYVQPEHFRDVGRSRFDRERTLKLLSEFLQSLGRQLPDGQTLKLEVTDVDLAGEIRPGSVHDVRVLRGGADWPQLSLRYTLQADGRLLRSGEARIADMNYLFDLRHPARDSGELSYEKRMVRQWFDLTFMAH